MRSLAEGKGKDKAPRGVPGWRIGVAALLLLLLPGGVQAQVAPDADWRTLDTPHFSVTFPAGLEEAGRHAGARAEAAWEALARVLPTPSDGHRIELLLTDQVDFSNGLASVTPARRIVIYLRPPVDGFALAHFDDWLDLVITHELAHVFHLDVTGGLGRFLRGLFGRLPAPWPLFPGLGTPDWTIEGLATWYETEFTGTGRTRGTYFEMMLRTAALEGAFATLDRASGSSPQWPAGETAYLYGSLFFQHLLETHGPDRMHLFVDAVASQWVPYRLNAAAEEAFGVSFSRAWEEWAEGWRLRAAEEWARLEAAGPLTRPEQLTRNARLAVHPRVSREGRVAFARADGRSDSQLRILEGDGTAFLLRTHGVARFDWTPGGGVVVAQPEFQDPYRIRSDLWRWDPRSGMERLTDGARLDHPSVSPDGAEVVAIEYAGRGSRLVARSLEGESQRVLTRDPESVAWAFPAHSPDGRWIAATRWAGDGADVLVLDALTGAVALEVTRDAALDLAPTWSPDGGTLVWGSDRSGIPQIVAAEVDPARGGVGPVQAVTRVVTGAAFPAVDPTGEWLYFSHYTARGWELARTPWDPTAWTPAPALDPRFARTPEPPPAPPVEGPVRGYASLPSLRPRYWQPLLLPGKDTPDGDLIRPLVGFSTTASDLVGRHTVRLQGALSLSGRELDGRLQYAWAGLGNPVLDLSVVQEWDGDGPFQARAQPEDPPTTLYLREREQRASLGATLTRARWTSTVALAGRAGMVWQSRELLDRAFQRTDAFQLRRPETRLSEGELSLAFSTARGHALSVSPEEGVSGFLLVRTRREVGLVDSLRSRPGVDASTDEVLGQLRLYQSLPGPGFADHVLALRLAGAAARGPGADGLTWEVGGTAGQTETFSGFNLFGGTSYFLPVRGYPEGVRAGRLAWAASAEYRFPLFLVNRGLGLFPLHLDRVHGGLFADAGNAWGPELGLPGYDQPRLDPVWSVGGEVTARLLLLFDLPLALRVGVAFPEAGHPNWYLRLGPSF